LMFIAGSASSQYANHSILRACGSQSEIREN
jgi:hypothetical protein